MSGEFEGGCTADAEGCPGDEDVCVTHEWDYRGKGASGKGPRGQMARVAEEQVSEGLIPVSVFSISAVPSFHFIVFDENFLTIQM